MRSSARLSVVEKALSAAPRPAPNRQINSLGLEEFVLATFPAFEWNWHHRLICKNLERLERGEIRRLMIFAPPRSGKTELVSRRFPAWCLGRHPDWHVIGSSHTSGLAAEVCGHVQDIVDSPEYRSIYPHVRLAGSSQDGPGQGRRKPRRTQTVFGLAGCKGGYRGVGTKVRISGYGFNLGILDDPIGDDEEAFSQAYRNRIFNWYNTTFRSRKEADNRILLTVTRWSPDDLPGRLLAKALEDARADQWEVIRLPALAEGSAERHPEDPRQEGDPLWPARAGQFDLTGILSDRASMPAFQFQALMQQRPTAQGGAVFKEEWFGSFAEEGVGYRTADGKFIPRAQCWRLVILDPATADKPGSDYTAIGAFAIGPAGDVLVLDMVRERLPLEQVAPRLRQIWDLYRPLYVGLEGVGFQKAVGVLIRQLIPHADVRLLDPQGKSKLVRALPAIVRAEARQIHLPRPAPTWVRPFLVELSSFTGMGDMHDDQVDCLAYCVQCAGGATSEKSALPLSLGDKPGLFVNRHQTL